MKKYKFLPILLFLFSSLNLFSIVTEEKKVIDPDTIIKITDPSYRLLNLAIPEFSLSNKNTSLKSLAKKMRTTLYRLSDYTGVFRIVSEKAYTGFERSKGQKSSTLSDHKGSDFTQWKTLGIEVLLKIKIKSEFLSTKATVEAFDTMQAKRIVYI